MSTSIVTLYIWPVIDTHTRFGHVAMKLRQNVDDEGVYISIYEPQNSNKNEDEKNGKQAPDLAQRPINTKNRRYAYQTQKRDNPRIGVSPAIFHLRGLNVDDMITAYRNFEAYGYFSSEATYSFFSDRTLLDTNEDLPNCSDSPLSHTCSSLTLALLHIGGFGSQYFDLLLECELKPIHKYLIKKRDVLKNFLLSLQEIGNSASNLRDWQISELNRGWLALCNEFSRLLYPGIATPDDIHELCKQHKQMQELIIPLRRVQTPENVTYANLRSYLRFEFTKQASNDQLACQFLSRFAEDSYKQRNQFLLSLYSDKRFVRQIRDDNELECEAELNPKSTVLHKRARGFLKYAADSAFLSVLFIVGRIATANDQRRSSQSAKIFFLLSMSFDYVIQAQGIIKTLFSITTPRSTYHLLEVCSIFPPPTADNRALKKMLKRIGEELTLEQVSPFTTRLDNLLQHSLRLPSPLPVNSKTPVPESQTSRTTMKVEPKYVELLASMMTDTLAHTSKQKSGQTQTKSPVRGLKP